MHHISHCIFGVYSVIAQLCEIWNSCGSFFVSYPFFGGGCRSTMPAMGHKNQDDPTVVPFAIPC